MTATCDEEAAFLRAIAADEGDDTARLVYADWLQENGREDRGEMIRIHVERDRIGQSMYMVEELRALFKRHPEWSRIECPACKGSSVEGDGQDRIHCLTCFGHGDLLTHGNGGRPSVSVKRPLSWSRGFIHSLTARSGEVWETQAEGGNQWAGIAPTVTRPTPWALAVVRALPMLREVRLSDVEPECRNFSLFGWHSSTHTPTVAYADDASGPPTVPQELLDAMTGYVEVVCPPHLAKWFKTREVANTALGLAVCDWIRGHG